MKQANNEHHFQSINQKKYRLKPEKSALVKVAEFLELVNIKQYLIKRRHKLPIHYFFSSFYINLLICSIKKEGF